MQYQHTNTSHNRSWFSSVAEIAGGMGLRSPQPQQLALDFAPAQVRSHGLRDAHTYPQVARRKGASFRVPASQAWGFAYLELRAGNSWPLMGFDCDVPEKVLDALVSNHWGARSDVCPALPEPNMIVQRRSNSHSHVSYFLAKPVHRGATAREAPLRLFARISEFYRQALGADPGYNGVLTHNPMRSAHRHGEFLTHWGCNRPYSLSELAEPIPRGWRLPVKPTTEAGRNCALFVALMKWAGSPANIGREVLAVGRATNDGLDVPLGDSEVAGLAKSVEGYRDGWIAKGRFYTEAEREAWGRSLGLRGGVVRRAAKADRDERIIEGRVAGLSYRKLAQLFKLDSATVWHIVNRGVGRTTQYRDGWIAKGRFYTETEREAWGRSLGLRGGVVRRAAKADRDERIIEGRVAGLSYRKLAQLFKLDSATVWHIVNRGVGRTGVGRTTQIVSLQP